MFKSSGCTACHNGPAAGGASFRKMGVVEPYRTDNPAEGRKAVTGKDADRFSFKVPTLRNVELTYPYFHDGAASTLGEAVEIMGRIQLGKAYTASENEQIVAFLKTLTGDQPRFELPQLPPSSDARRARIPSGRQGGRIAAPMETPLTPLEFMRRARRLYPTRTRWWMVACAGPTTPSASAAIDGRRSSRPSACGRAIGSPTFPPTPTPC